MSVVARVRVFILISAVLFAFSWNVASAISTGAKPMPARDGAAPVAGGAGQVIAATQIFDDAVALKTFIAKDQGANVVALLKAYGVDVDHIDTTPFLNKVAYFNSTTFIASKGAAPGQLAAPQGLPLSGLGAGQVADALGSLIAERFKQEAEMEALHRLGEKILQLDCEYDGRPLSTGFPTTLSYLQTLEIGGTPRSCPARTLRPVQLNDWAVLQSSFKVDVAALPDNLPAFLDSLYGKSDKMDARYLTWLAATSAGQIYRNGKQPYQLIDEAVRASDTFWKLKQLQDDGGPNVIANVAAGLRALSILSHMLTKNAASEWHSAKDLEQFLDLRSCSSSCDSVFLLLGLSYAHDHELYSEVNVWLTKRGERTIEQLDAAVPKGDAAQGAAYVDRWRNTMNLTVTLAGSLESLYQHVQQIPVKLTSLSEARPLVGDLGGAAIEASGIIEAFVLMRPVSETELAATNCNPTDSFCTARTRIRETTLELQYGFDIMGEIKTQQYAAAFGQLIAYVGPYFESHQVRASQDFGSFFSANGAFIAAVASAHSTADLKAALDDYSLPAGSYTQQQAARFSVTLNSFFGAAVGAETLTGNLEGTGAARTRTRLGFAAPVGLDFNFGLVDNSKPSNGKFFETGAWSVFVPVLDVGAVASWRLGSGGGSVAAITWQNIVAPGLYAVWSKRDSPFSILLGAQYGPELRKVSAGGNTIEKAALQFPCLEFTFNIPIFNLYSRPRE